MSNLKIHISNFRAIEDAQIALNGITVLTGLNATGKSTIGRMMYYTGYFANHYHQLIDGILGRKMEGLRFIYGKILSCSAIHKKWTSSLMDTLHFKRQ